MTKMAKIPEVGEATYYFRLAMDVEEFRYKEKAPKIATIITGILLVVFGVVSCYKYPLKYADISDAVNKIINIIIGVISIYLGIVLGVLCVYLISANRYFEKNQQEATLVRMQKNCKGIYRFTYCINAPWVYFMCLAFKFGKKSKLYNIAKYGFEILVGLSIELFVLLIVMYICIWLERITNLSSKSILYVAVLLSAVLGYQIIKLIMKFSISHIRKYKDRTKEWESVHEQLKILGLYILLILTFILYPIRSEDDFLIEAVFYCTTLFTLWGTLGTRLKGH